MKNFATLSTGETGSDERRFEGTAVSRGIAVGRAVRLFGQKRQYFRKDIVRNSVPDEVERFRLALRAARSQIAALAGSDNSSVASAAEISQVHLLLIDDPKFSADVEAMIRGQSVNAEWSVKLVTEGLVARLLAVADANFRDRSIDIEDVSERILNALGDDRDFPKELLDGSVIVAASIRPSTLVELNRRRPLAIVTEHGGWTSHAFIMAREMRIPAVTGVHEILRFVGDGDEVIVDGYNGSVIVRPTQSSLGNVSLNHRSSERKRRNEQGRKGSPRTLDGREITLRINAESLESISCLNECGAAGVGLIRSEYLVGGWDAPFPSESDQLSAYEKIIDAAAPHTVRIRTFDLNADQLRSLGADREANPALGLRAIRIGLTVETIFRSQVRAVLRAARERKVAFILPMVTGVDEIILAKKMIDQENALLHRGGLLSPEPGVGAMIEVPSAVVMIDEILRLVDFVCVGTNDLVQYLLAVDRDNESVADFYQTLHPAVTRSVKTVIKAAEQANVPAVMCGEMAGSPFYVPVLIGLGAREFSMNVNSIERVRSVIEGISYEEARALISDIELASTATEAEERIRDFYSDKWPHLFSSDLLDRANERTVTFLEKN